MDIDANKKPLHHHMINVADELIAVRNQLRSIIEIGSESGQLNQALHAKLLDAVRNTESAAIHLLISSAAVREIAKKS